MKMLNIPFGTTDWAKVEKTEHKGEQGVAYWRTQNFDTIRVARLSIRRAMWPITGAQRDIS